VNMRFFNRRKYPRRTANEVVWIEKVPTILERCTLVDVSETGARLTISDVYDLPESFALHLTREADAGRRCQIIWQRGMKSASNSWAADTRRPGILGRECDQATSLFHVKLSQLRSSVCGLLSASVANRHQFIESADSRG
jgi:hypothetical protein